MVIFTASLRSYFMSNYFETRRVAFAASFALIVQVMLIVVATM